MTRTIDDQHDIVIVGDGIAALAASRALQWKRHVPLRVAPPRTAPRNRGELLGPRGRVSLASLDWAHLLNDPALSLPAEARYSAWGSPRLATVGHGTDTGWYVDRALLEAAMRADVGMPRDGAITGMAWAEDGWQLTVSTGESLSARFVIDASGRAATIARRFGGHRQRESGLIAMHHELAVPGATVMAASLIEAVPDGWWYTAPVPRGGRLFVAHFTDRDLLPPGAIHGGDSLRDLLSCAPLTRARLDTVGAALPASPWRIDVAATTRQERVAGDGWAAAGDAAVALDPLSGHGLTVALWSGIQAAGVARAWLDGDRDPSRAFQDAVTIGLHRVAVDAAHLYRAERRFREHPFWSRRHAATVALHERIVTG